MCLRRSSSSGVQGVFVRAFLAGGGGGASSESGGIDLSVVESNGVGGSAAFASLPDTDGIGVDDESGWDDGADAAF